MKKRPEQKWVRIPENVYKFLLGEGTLRGRWFGESPPIYRGRPYWWRHFLRRK